MAEYIEREALRVAIHNSWQSNPHNDRIARQAHNHEHRHFLVLVHQQPSADVVEVVRCKDCVHYCGFEHCKNGICDRDSVSKWAVYPTDFCSYGERKEV